MSLRSLLSPQPRLRIFGQLLLAFLLVALLPLALFWQFERLRITESGQAAAESQLSLFSQRVVQQVDDWTALNLSVMKLAADQPGMRSFDPAAQRRVIASVQTRLPWAYLIHTAGLDGSNLARSDDGPLSNYSDRHYYGEILAGASQSVEIGLGRTSHRPAFLVAVPIKRVDGSLGGLLIQAAQLDEVTRAVSSAALGRTGHGFLMTAEGRLIAHADEQLNRELKDYSRHPAFIAARDHGDGLQRYSIDGVARIADIRHTRLGWIAVAEQDEAESRAVVDRANRNALALLGLTAALVSLLSLAVARGFAAPIERVTRVAEQISRGDLDVEVEASARRDQIGELQRAMLGVRDTLRRFIDSQGRIASAVARGDFSQRADESAFTRVYADMVRQLNQMTETADRGLSEFARVLAAVARGELDVAVEGEFEGTFAQLQRDTRVTVESLAHLIAQLELNRGLLRAALEHLPQGVSVVDLDLRLIAWNRRYAEIFDYPPELLAVGTPIESLMRVNAGRGLMGRGDAEWQVQRRLQHLQSGNQHVNERELPDGTVLEIRGSALPGIGYVTSFSDVTAYKQTEAELRALTATLERRVDERTRDLASATAAAERANRYKTRFVSSAVHDLLQPLNAARMFASALLAQLQDAQAQQLARSIDGALAAQDQILASLLDISRLESGTLETRVQDFAIAPLLDALAREFGVLAQARGLMLRARSSKAIVRSDPILLRRILQNFLSNALRYTPRGRIVFGCRRVPGALRIEVWDTGPGIPQHQQQLIFEEFRRLDPGPDVHERGSGLGLAIVDRIARRLEHPITLRSQPGRGSVFAVSVPLGDASRVEAEPGDAPLVKHDDDSASLRDRLIWCIDDDANVREANRSLLRAWGCRVQLFDGPAQALAQANAQDVPELLLLDNRLGETRGPDLLPALVERWQAQPPVILVTADADPALRSAAREAGWGFLAKPVKAPALRALMTRLLSLRGFDR
ncbi:PAS-domain containing protein [Hydrocarboniphaga effusa]|uniref:PAS-domain containing protein n=1 Tax=Hydrocarboniphaga effusa TaxID=243629 RepID=UPI0035B4D001